MPETNKSNRRILILMGIGLAMALGVGLAAVWMLAVIRPTAAPSPATLAKPPITIIYVIPVVASLTPTPTLAPTNTPTITPISSPTFTLTPRRTNTPTFTATITNAPSITATVTATRAPSQAYSTLPVPPPPIDRPASQHADLNLGLRGYVAAPVSLQLLDLQGATDPGGPQLTTLFADNTARPIQSAYQVYNWDWNCNCRTQPIDEPAVTMIGLSATAGDTLHVPEGGSDILNDFRVLVLYADAQRITLKYTRSDTIDGGYALHVEGIAVDPNLLAVYQQANSAGRGNLPALRARQPFGEAVTGEVKVAIRDTGEFMEPRSRKDWWR